MNRLKIFVLAVVVTAGLSGCSTFNKLVYKINIPQGNFIEQNQIDKLRIGMSPEQVEFVLGKPVVDDSFASGTWYYLYQFKNGRTNELTRKELIINFENDKVVSVTGDYDLSDSFYTPLEAGQS